jgi:hypothetical protein
MDKRTGYSAVEAYGDKGPCTPCSGPGYIFPANSQAMMPARSRPSGSRPYRPVFTARNPALRTRLYRGSGGGVVSTGKAPVRGPGPAPAGSENGGGHVFATRETFS